MANIFELVPVIDAAKATENHAETVAEVIKALEKHKWSSLTVHELDFVRTNGKEIKLIKRDPDKNLEEISNSNFVRHELLLTGESMSIELRMFGPGYSLKGYRTTTLNNGSLARYTS